MDKYNVLSQRFYRFFKYLRTIGLISLIIFLGIVAAISFVVFLIINAFNTGNDILFWISYVLLMLSIIGAIQCICLYFIGKYYGSKSK